MYESGRAKAIGVSNYTVEHLEVYTMVDCFLERSSNSFGDDDDDDDDHS